MFTAQVASRTWDELSEEARNTTNQGSVVDGDDAANGDGLEWVSLWGIEPSSLPTFYTAWQKKDQAAKLKIRKVVKEEWEYMERREALATERVEGSATPSLPRDSRFPPPGAPLLSKDGRMFDIAGYVSESTAFPYVLMESFWRYSDPSCEWANDEDGRSLPSGAPRREESR